MTQPKLNPRPIHVVAREIRNNWSNPFYGAVPYLQAMASLDKITDNYEADTGRYVVAGFLSNCQAWRGVKAREIKAELRKILKGAK